ncbi:hypothetical protein FACS1894132_07400 [Clostridia bacterium]|nr:hypothetical protein FACS1894132_07400 [Clostridia bacterium]
MKSVAVVICNYNKKNFVLNCIKSVFASNFTNFDLIVVDNASNDGSVQEINEQFADRLTLLVNDENLGGSGGFNRGMEYAMEKGYKYIHLLDNDVVIDKNAISSLYEFMEKHIDAGVCGSLILRMDKPDIIQDYGANIDLENFTPKANFKDKKADKNLIKYLECDYVAACSAMYRLETLQKTGAINKDFFLYWDDMSLSKEILLAGYKVYAEKSSKVWHNHSIFNYTPFTTYYFLRNKIRYFTTYLNDSDFEKFVKSIILRMFRTLAVNRDKPEILLANFNALDDALNDVRGKASNGKILPMKEYELPQSAVKIKHVLDEKNYDKTKIYIDNYNNILKTEKDFDLVENIIKYNSFFEDIFGEFIKIKLVELRKNIGVKK